MNSAGYGSERRIMDRATANGTVWMAVGYNAVAYSTQAIDIIRTNGGCSAWRWDAVNGSDDWTPPACCENAGRILRIKKYRADAALLTAWRAPPASRVLAHHRRRGSRDDAGEHSVCYMFSYRDCYLLSYAGGAGIDNSAGLVLR